MTYNLVNIPLTRRQNDLELERVLSREHARGLKEGERAEVATRLSSTNNWGHVFSIEECV